MTKLLSPNLLSWDMDGLLTLWPLLIPCSLGNGCYTLGFLIFIIVVRNFLYHSLYITHRKIIKAPLLHKSLGPCVCLSFSLSLSLSLTLLSWFLGVQRPVLLTLLPGLLRLSWEGALCLHRPREGTQCLRERHKSCVEGFIGFLHKPGSISLSLSHFLIVTSGPPGPGPLKDPNSSCVLVGEVGSFVSKGQCCT